jgi:autotransporter strand-loop-strand O-heptosyltransferase
MNKPKLYIHGSYIGTTGYNNHTRDFFRKLSKHIQLKVRNFTVGSSWNGNNKTPHDGEKYLTDLDKSLLYKQRLWTDDGQMEDFTIYPSPTKEFNHDIDLVLNETNHYLFYQNYNKPKIAYNVWESTLQPEDFFNKLKEFDELWVPSKWQKECSIKQGYPEDKIKVVPEGVDVDTFYPEQVDLLDEYEDGRFKFLLMGRWDYRKSTKEIIQTFLKTFSDDEPVDLVVSVDNMWGEQMDGFKSTEERLASYGLIHPRVKIIHFPTREDYIKYLKTGHVFVSCARSEGWNLPLIEAMACGTPSIYSNCSAQLEFAEGKGFPINIIEEKVADANDYGRYKMSDLPGNYYEPDFNHLSQVMKYVYENYELCKQKSITESEDLRDKFNWEKIGEIGYKTIMEFYNKINSEEYKNQLPKNEIKVSYLEGPKVEIVGDKDEEYLIEFLNEKGEVIYSDAITNNMWTSCSRKYYTKWKIKVNGVIIDEFDLTNRRVLIGLESKSIGDTIAWTPYAIEFAKKHNCKVILSTFNNEWFKGLDAYKDIEFIEPGQSTECYAIYKIGWFRGESGKWDKLDMYPNYPQTQPLQKTASDILGLEFKELNYGINFTLKPKSTKTDYIVIAPESTTGCKEWPYDSWVALSKMLRELGYTVVTLTIKPYNIKGNLNIHGKTLNESMDILYNAKFLIGLSSGLSWINWALGKQTVMISGFSSKDHEFQSNNIRIQNEHACNSCWGNTNFTFDPGDWDWCPIWKGTDKQHICEKSISPLKVFNLLPL